MVQIAGFVKSPIAPRLHRLMHETASIQETEKAPTADIFMVETC